MRKKTIAIWCPSSPAPILFPTRFQRAVRNIQSNNFKVMLGHSCSKLQRFDKNYKDSLTAELYTYLKNPRVDIILFATGGLTTATLLDVLDWDFIKKYPKPIIGYSDATSFLLAYNAKTGLECFHGPMLISEWGECGGLNSYSLEIFNSVISNLEVFLTPPRFWTEEFLFWDKEDIRPRIMKKNKGWFWYRNGVAEGKLVGGNLSTICLMQGTDFLPSFRNCILFLEEDSCTPDEMYAKLQSLKLSGVFEEISGLVIGKVANKKVSSSGLSDFNLIYHHIFKDYNFPILTEVDFGHTNPMITLPIGRIAVIDSDKKGILIKKNE